MGYPIDRKLVIAVASSALFDLTESDRYLKKHGDRKYRRFQEKNIDKPFKEGVAYPFIKRLLDLNLSFPEKKPVEVILMSKNSPEAGERVFRSIEFYKLNITRACFTSGNPHYQYLPAFNASLFLSANLYDVKEALMNNHAAGRVLNNNCSYRDGNKGLIIAFDFDGVIASDKSDKVYRDLDKNMEKYHEYEDAHSAEALELGPIGGLLQKLSFFQKLEKKKKEEEPSYERLLRTAIVTARNAPAHKRVISSLKKWQVEVDEIFFLGGIDKSRILNVMKPHIFFDDQLENLKNIEQVPAVHIPFGITNRDSLQILALPPHYE